MRRTYSCLIAFVVITLVPATTWADQITDWNQTMLRAALVGGTSPPVTTRVAAIVQAAVFDAVNGIARRYTPVRVEPAGPAGASQEAAAVQAAYATLVQLYPAQKSTFDARLAVSLAVLDAREDSAAIASGRAWGQTVADAILAWRSTDGFTPAPPPFLGGTAVGQWRPTPPAFASGAVAQFPFMTPWAIVTPSQFRPAGPPALTSAQYAKDFNETKMMGNMVSTTRTPDQTVSAWFWASATPSFLWNTAAVSLVDGSGSESDEDGDHTWHDNRHDSTLQNARLLAQLNVAIADSAIACFEAKYTYVLWRPVTAIPLADTDANPKTTADPAFVSQRRGRCRAGEPFRRADPLQHGIRPDARRRPAVQELLVGAGRSPERPHRRRHSFSIRDARRHDRWGIGRQVCPRARCPARALAARERLQSEEPCGRRVALQRRTF